MGKHRGADSHRIRVTMALLAVAPVVVWIGFPGGAEGGLAGRSGNPHVYPSPSPLSAGGLVSSGGAAGARGLGALPARRGNVVSSAYGRLPLSFEENRGQNDPRARFVSRGPGYALALTTSGPVLSLARRGGHGRRGRSAVLGMGFAGGRPQVAPVASGRLPGAVNYVIGRDRRRWHLDVPTYSRASYRGVWPGIDVVFHGEQRRLEYDFVLAPEADPGRIVMRLSGARSMRLDRDGNLIVGVDGGSVRERAPKAYQSIGGSRRPLASRYVLLPGRRVGVRLGAYDHRRALVIDPTLSYSTYLGGSGLDDGRGIAVDASGSAYVTGQADATSPTFPTPGGSANVPGRALTTFVAKLNPAGSAFSYVTFVGGNQPATTVYADPPRPATEYGDAIAVDPGGSAYITGSTSDAAFPTKNAIQPVYKGGLTDGFVVKLDPAGALSYSTYLGGSGGDTGAGIAVDGRGSAYVTGDTGSADFPTKNAPQPAIGSKSAEDSFVAKLDPDGSALTYATYLGGSGGDVGQAIAIDASGDAYATGETRSTDFPTTGGFQPSYGGNDKFDAFVTEIKPEGTGFIYSSYLGGSANDFGIGIAVDAAGSAYVGGATQSNNFPVTSGAYQTTFAGGTCVNPGSPVFCNPNDAFVTKVNHGGSRLTYSTYVGGAGSDEALGAAVDGSGSAYITGVTNSQDFPTTADAAQPGFGGSLDVFVAKLDPAGSALVYGSYLGGIGEDGAEGAGLVGGVAAIAVDRGGSAYLTGATNSPDFPVTPGAAQTRYGGSTDAFVAKVTPTANSSTPQAAGGDSAAGGAAAGGSAGGGSVSSSPAVTAPGPGMVSTSGGAGAQEGTAPAVALSAGEARRARALRSCLALVAAHAKRELAGTRRGSARHRVTAKRHRNGHAASGRARCLRLYGRTPGRVTGLVAGAVSQSKLALSFLAVGSDGMRPPAAARYVVKQSSRPIVSARDFARARALCAGACRFGRIRVGQRLVLSVTDLKPKSTYFYAVAALDNVSGRLGPRSRTVAVRTR